MLMGRYKVHRDDVIGYIATYLSVREYDDMLEPQKELWRQLLELAGRTSFPPCPSAPLTLSPAYCQSIRRPNFLVRVSPRDWTAPVALGESVSVVVFTGAAAAEVLLNGVSVAGRRNVAALGYADFGRVPFAPGNLTAVAYDRTGAVVAVDSVLTAGAPAALQLRCVRGWWWWLPLCGGDHMRSL